MTCPSTFWVLWGTCSSSMTILSGKDPIWLAGDPAGCTGFSDPPAILAIPPRLPTQTVNSRTSEGRPPLRTENGHTFETG